MPWIMKAQALVKVVMNARHALVLRVSRKPMLPTAQRESIANGLDPRGHLGYTDIAGVGV